MMAKICVFLYVLLFKICVSKTEHLWHSYMIDEDHKNREELIITNVTSDEDFKLDFDVEKWKGVKIEQRFYVAGLSYENRSHLVLASIFVDPDNNFNVNQSITLDLESVRIVDFALFEHWNSSSRQSTAILTVATDKPEILWYKVENFALEKFWSWPLVKNITHINIFKINLDYEILLISEYFNEPSADLYEFDVNKRNFWLRQSLRLSDAAKSSAISTFGPDYFISIPQKSLNSLLVYKLSGYKFVPFRNLTSFGIDEVISFEIGFKSFIAFNGFNAGIHKFTRTELLREDVIDSQLDSVDIWVTLKFNKNNREDFVLIAQRSLDHGLHHSYVVEIITYNGVRFEEHEDITCTYFGEISTDLSCLTTIVDEDTGGIEGAIGISLGTNNALLVPKNNRFSELFIFNSTIKKNPNPVEIEVKLLKERMSYLDTLVKQQQSTYEEIIEKNDTSTEISKPREADHDNLDDFVVDDLEIKVRFVSEAIDELNSKMATITEIGRNRSHYEKIVFKNHVEVEGNATFITLTSKTIGGMATHEVLNDIVRKDQMGTMSGAKTFKNLDVENLDFNQVNNISAKNLIFKSDENIVIAGNLKLDKPLAVMGTISTKKFNGIDTNPNEMIQFESIQVLGDLQIENLNDVKLRKHNINEAGNPNQIQFDTLVVPENIQVGNVNGEDFNQFLNQLCMKNIKTFVPGTVMILGNISISKSLIIKKLNNLDFPEDYVSKDESGAVISGRKKFFNSLETSEMFCNGLFDGVKVDEIVTLETDQNLAGKYVLTNLEVTETLDIQGKVSGEDVTKFLPNPSMNQTHVIKSKVVFKDLEVEGAIIILEKFNNKDIESLLADVVYQNEEEVKITGPKVFTNGFTTNQLRIKTNSINNFTLDQLVTRNSDQILNISLINGNVTIKNLEIDGLYDGINITEFDQNTVKLNGEQYISSTLIFNDFNDLQLKKSLIIVKTLNDLSPEDYLFTNKLIQIVNGTIDLDNISADNIEVLGEFRGDIEDFDLDDFNNRRLSYTENQEITGHLIMKRSIAENLITTGTINDIPSEELIDEEIVSHNVIGNLIAGKYKINELVVDGSLDIMEVNGENGMNLGGIFSKHNNLKNITFHDPIHFAGNVAITNLSGVNFNNYVKSIIFKNESSPTFHSSKFFTNGLKIKKYVETKMLNDIKLDNILTKYGKQIIKGPVHVEGDVKFGKELNLTHTLNGIPITSMNNDHIFEGDKFTITGDVLFERLVHIYDLQISGSHEGTNINGILDSIIYKNRHFNLSGLTIFKNTVDMKGNLRVIDKCNGVDLTSFASNVVMTTKDVSINSPIRFLAPVIINQSLNLDGNLDTRYLGNVDLEKWKENAIFINRGLLEGSYTFEHGVIVGNLYTEFLNDVNMSQVIRLRTKDHLPDLKFEEVTILNDINVGNTVNGFDLQQELSNTLLTGVDQIISSEIIFNRRPKFERDMIILGNLNGKSVNKIVTTTTDQNLTAVYNFNSKITMERGLSITGYVNGINVTLWELEAVKTWAPYTQEISDSWTGPNSNVTFDKRVDGYSLINGLDLVELRDVLESKRSYKYSMEELYINNYNKICKDLNYMHKQIKNQIYKFNYLENLQLLTFSSNVHYLYNFKFNYNHFMIVNEENSCKAYVLVWIKTQFQQFKEFDLGQVSQIISTTADDKLFLIIRNEPSKCDFSGGTHIWSFDGYKFEVFAKIDNLDLLQESLIPGTFYATFEREVSEFQVNPNVEPMIKKYRKWEVNEENMVFVPRGLRTGLAISTGIRLVKLDRHETEFSGDSFGYETEAVIIGNFSKTINIHLPGGEKNEDCVVMTVGTKSSKRNLLAIASFEETSIKGSLDFIKIYEDVVSGKLFQKVPAYKPSSLITINFENGETLLAFMEDLTTLQIYEYKGIEGFKHRFSLKLVGTKLFEMSLPLDPYTNRRKVIGIVNKNQIEFLEAMMLGNQVREELRCML